MGQPAGRVLVVGGNADIASIVEQVLTDEGYAVTVLGDSITETVRATVVDAQPDCVLVGSDVVGPYAASGANVAWMTAQSLTVPVIMISSEQRRAAEFSSVLPKPFDLDELVRAVALAVRQSPFRPRP
jgi:DNA-binding response OmpR family regulator